jgi:ribosomal protein L37AE/L43A
MMTPSNHRSVFGMNCPECGDLLIAPEWSEYEDERHILNLWSCANCGYHFETEALLPAAKAANDAATIKAFFPSLLVG